MNGFDTTIFELHSIAGGLCTAWKRKGYMIDNCISWLAGASDKNKMYDLWNEVIDMKNIDFHFYDIYMKSDFADGGSIITYCDVDKTEKEWLEKAPEDSKCIKEFCDSVRKMSSFNPSFDNSKVKSRILEKILSGIEILPFMGVYRKWFCISIGDYAKKIKNENLRKTFLLLFEEKMSTFFIISMLAWMNNKTAGYPMGGSLPFAMNLEKRYLELGGTVNYKSKVKKILTVNDKAIGVELENGTIYEADIVISAADGFATIFNMLEGKYINQQINDYYSNFPTFPSYFIIGLGVSRSFEGEPSSIAIEVDNIRIGPETTSDTVFAQIFNFDPSMSPKGKTSIRVLITCKNYQYWVDLKNNDPQLYQSEKQRIADQVIEILDQRLGNVKNNIEMIDVATPSSVIEHTNNWRGSMEGWILTTKTGFRMLQRELPGLKDFYMTGQWVMPGGGLPSGIMSGRSLARLLCKQEGLPFMTTNHES